MIAVALALAAPDFDLLDTAIDKCDRNALMPVFAGEAGRRSMAATAFYDEQATISAERLAIADRRRALRETVKAPPPKPTAIEKPLTDQALSLVNLALDDRQRALDDQRRLEAMRQDAIDLKRRYYLVRCATTKDDLK